MASETSVVKKKKKKHSKKSKQSWRSTDITDVEEYLEEVRRDERTGGSAAEKADSSLFFVDKVTLETSDKDEALSKGSRKRKIPKPNEVHLNDGSKKSKNTKSRNQEQANSESSDEELEKHRNKIKATNRELKEKKQKKPLFDLWTTNDNPEGDEHYLKTTRKTKIKAPETTKRKVTQLPSVEVCAPGASYNPTYEEHQDLLKKANEVEVKKLQKMEKMERQLQWITKEEAAKLPTWEEEMSQGLFEEEENPDDNDDDDNGDDLKPAVKSTRRKTKQQRRKQSEEKKRKRDQRVKKELKLKENDVFRIKALNKQIHAKEKKIQEKIQKKEERKKDELKKTKRLGPHLFEEPDIEIQLSEEITGNLRSMKTEGNLFKDRYKSMQKRNIIETRKSIRTRRKYALKKCVRRSYNQPCIKEFTAGK